MKRCSVCDAKIRDLALVCNYCGNDDFSKTLPQQIGELKKMIKEALPIIRRDADEDGHHYSEAAAKWLEKYNEVTHGKAN